MLYRTIDDNRICITQPTHAWVSGQMAQVWGNAHFGKPTPFEAVCLGAEQHDIGWVPWEAAPTFNPETGYPHSFREVAVEVHTQLWAGAKHLTLPMGRYVALLVSLHGTGLYERFTQWQQSPDATRVVEAFLREEKQFQQQMIQRLGEDPAYAPYVTEEAIAHNQRLVATLDTLSLLICMGVTQPRQIDHVPTSLSETSLGETSLTLTPINGDPTQLQVEPWCFQDPEVTVVFEGRILQEPSLDASMMRDRLGTAPWATVRTVLQA